MCSGARVAKRSVTIDDDDADVDDDIYQEERQDKQYERDMDEAEEAFPPGRRLVDVQELRFAQKQVWDSKIS